ncbi:MAG: competence protein, partial [Marinovum sp.]|nr:competence protein [Marinovum sp.]
MGRIKSALEREILNQRAHWFNWSLVILAFGIGAYFELPNEPNFSPYIWISIIEVCGFGFIVFPSIATRVLFGATLIFCLGFCAAAFRANHVSAPVLKYRYYGPIEGRVIAIDKSNSDALRITLDGVKMGKISAKRTPDRIRLSLLSKAKNTHLYPGSIIETIGFMMPPQSPVEPSGF